MVTQSAPAVVEHRTLGAVTFHIRKPDIVTPEDIVQTLDGTILFPLLPVEPPEINALVYIGMQIGIEECLHVFLVRSDPAVCLAVVLAQTLHKLVVFLLVGAYAISGMQVHGSLHALLVQVF